MAVAERHQPPVQIVDVLAGQVGEERHHGDAMGAVAGAAQLGLLLAGDRVAAYGGLVAQVDHRRRRWFGGDAVGGPGKSDGAGDRGRGHGQNSAE